MIRGAAVAAFVAVVVVVFAVSAGATTPEPGGLHAVLTFVRHQLAYLRSFALEEA